MILYQKEELLSSTTISRNFGDYLNKLNKKQIEKIAVMRNNRIEAIILPIEVYEKIYSLEEIKEHLEISNIINQRMNSPENRISFEEFLNQFGVNYNDL